MSSFYEPEKIYEVSVVDMLSPEVPVFTCGLNGIVKEYPTRRPIKLSGAQINMLMSCCIPQAEVQDVDGLRKVVGRSEYPRFAITQRGMGVFPTAKAMILDPYKNIPIVKAEQTVVEDPDFTPEEIDAMSEPVPDRQEQLEAATKSELTEYAKQLGIQVGPRAGREAIIRAILKSEAEDR